MQISKAKHNLWKDKSTLEKQQQLNTLENGRQIRWNNPTSRKTMSQKYTGNGNPFFGKSHTEETKSKQRKATTERLVTFWKTNTLAGINTKPEKQMQELLRVKGIEFETPFTLQHKIYDLYLPKYNTIIEVDGCYWHSKNIPTTQMNKQQLRRWKNDRYKDNLARKNGYKLLRVWEDEIQQFNIQKELVTNE